jgi:hypothetical protein
MNSSFRCAGRITNGAMLVDDNNPKGYTQAVFYDLEEPGEVLAERASACLNACRGIENPEATVPELARALNGLMEANPEIAAKATHLHLLLDRIAPLLETQPA